MLSNKLYEHAAKSIEKGYKWSASKYSYLLIQMVDARLQNEIKNENKCNQLCSDIINSLNNPNNLSKFIQYKRFDQELEKFEKAFGKVNNLNLNNE